MSTNKKNTIIEKYRLSDPDRRSSLFLGYPDLRSDFMAMEMAEYKGNNRLAQSKNEGIGPGFHQHAVVIIGAGLNGLAAAYELKKSGIEPVILDAADRPAAAWRSRHAQLRLNTHRLTSFLPGMRIPRRCGAFPHRDDIVAYLEAYERRLNIPVHRNVRVQRIEPATDGWRLVASDRTWYAKDIIIATGNERVPFLPHWPGRKGFTGELLHAAHLGNIDHFKDRSVLVVGAGNSGTDVLNHLVKIPTKAVWLSVRNGPTILPTRILGVPLNLFAPLMAKLPTCMLDRLMALSERMTFGNLGKYHLPKHPDGVATRLIRERVAPAIDDGFVAALKAENVTVVPQIERFDGADVELAGGQIIRPDAVICATGYRPGLEGLVGHLGVLNGAGRPLFNGSEYYPDYQGLWFMGMVPRLPGVFYAARGEARRLAKAIKKRQAAIHPDTVQEYNLDMITTKGLRGV